MGVGAVTTTAVDFHALFMIKNTKQKLLSLALSGSVLVGNIPAAFALDGYNTVNASGKGQSAVTLSVEYPKEAVLSATVPAELPIKMDLDGNVTVPTNAAIINGVTDKDIAVTDVHVDLADGWEGAPYTDDVYFQANDTQVMALRFRGEEMQKDGTIPVKPEQWTIGAGQELPLKMEAKLPKQTVAGSKGKVATVSYTLDWAKKDAPSVSHVHTLTILDGEYGTINDKSPIQTNENGVIQGFPNVTPDDGYELEKWINAETKEELHVGDTLTSDISICPVFKQKEQPSETELSVDWDNGLMLPGSKNVAVFKWATIDANNTLQNVVSDNPDIQLALIDQQAVAESPAISRAVTTTQDSKTAESPHTGECAYIVTAKKRGVAHVTGQLLTGETASFTVNVSELPEGADGTQDAPIEGSATIKPTAQPGSSLKADDLNITIPVIQPDGTTENVPITLTPDNLPNTPLTEGDNEISVTTDVNGVTIHIVIHIVIETRPSVSASPASMVVSKVPDKTDYHPGENFDQTGMEIIVTYDDGSTKTLTSGYIVTDGANLPNGKNSVNITYTENGKTVSTTQSITTAPDSSKPDDSKTPVSISVTPDSYKKDYTEGEDFDPDGMTVEVTYADDHTETKTEGFTIVDGSKLTPDDKTVTVSYTEKETAVTTTIPITVASSTPNSATVKTLPAKTEYMEGEDFDPAGMEIEIAYTDGHKETKPQGFTVTDGKSLPVNKENVTISYVENDTTVTTSVPIKVKSQRPTSMAISKQPDKTAYRENENFDSSGLELIITYADGHTETKNDGFTVSEGEYLTPKDNKVTVSYTEAETTVTADVLITVESCTPVSAEVKTPPTKTEYMEGENFDAMGMEIEIAYADGHKETKTQGFTVTDGENLPVSKENVTVSYTENGVSLTANVPITVTQSGTLDKNRMANVLQNLTGKISFFNTAYTGTNGTDISAEQNGSIKAVVSGNNAVVYQQGGVKAPADSSSMFSGYKCTALDCTHLDTSNVINMGNMFNLCTDLTSLDVTTFDTSNVTDMSYMFWYCCSLTSLDISNFNTSNIANMCAMFGFCKILASLDVSNFATSKVTDMSHMFYDCESLSVLDLSNFDTSKVTDMSYMFSYCRFLASLNLSSFDTSNVTNMQSMFADIKPQRKTGEYSYEVLDPLLTLDLSNFDTSNVTNMSHTFAQSSFVGLDISNLDTSNVTDMSFMFCVCDFISLDLTAFDTSNVINMEAMFSGCVRLTSLDLSTFDTSDVINMNSMFYNCGSLTSLDLASFDTSNVTDMRNMFGCCKARVLARNSDEQSRLSASGSSSYSSNCTFVVK